LTEFEFVDMRKIPGKYSQKFDFTWSACALEHLGSLDAGMDFILESMKTIKPGGVAIHTTEFNVSSEDSTIEIGDTVLYRKKDLEKLIQKARMEGFEIDMDWNYGGQPLDYYVDIPPYQHNPHLKLLLSGYTATSVGLIISKPTH
jgi:hypothetical protein